MSAVYFDSTIFLAVFNDEASCSDIKSLLRELRRDGHRICTSIITIQEVSVLSFRSGAVAVENHSKVSRMARIQGVSKEVAIAAARIEAQMIERAIKTGGSHVISARRKWDCFHLATAVELQCSTIYTLDSGMLGCQEFIQESGIRISEPKPRALPLFKETNSSSVQ